MARGIRGVVLGSGHWSEFGVASGFVDSSHLFSVLYLLIVHFSADAPAESVEGATLPGETTAAGQHEKTNSH